MAPPSGILGRDDKAPRWRAPMVWSTITFPRKAARLPPAVQLPDRIWSGSLRFGSAGVPSFEGCLRDVSVGDLPPLSFYREEESGHPGNVTFWSVEKRVKVATTCLSSPQCGSASPCIRGECRDLWNAYACICPAGFEGALCEVNVDDCVKVDCGRGYCVDGVGKSRMSRYALKTCVEMVELVKM
ncbi:EGF-like domain protein [Necator americanus]|uniref:EGF-like domain protein n=1 Tax=Necator americanus TaxID=51031 RepID=W2TKL1_NECAM|nr:EGF-like domain protein [Necator americanus]ETN82635.1 EGF-like domain protein [Necator americanus]